MEEKHLADYYIILIVVILLAIGLVMILSASSIRAYNVYGDSYKLFKQQLISAILSIIAMFLFMNIDYHVYERFAKLIMILTLLILILVLVPGIGRLAGGSRRWIGLGPIGVQPSELAKVGIVIYLSYFVSYKRDRIESFSRGVIPPVIMMGIVFVLILAEPDLGTAVSIAGTFIIILFVAGVRFSHLFLLAITGLPMVMYFILSEDYRRERLFAFLDPWADPLDTGYHIIQSLLALGSGGLFGVGLGNSHQKFLYLPEPGTDFIFAVLGEEIGLLGTSLVVILYFLLSWRGFKVALYASDLFGSILAIGISSMIILQAIINIGVVTASMPITGITLPFISYGGSSLIIMSSGIGILLNISRNTGE